MKVYQKEGEASTEPSYPIYDLCEAVKIAEAIRDLGGSNMPVTKSLLAQHLKLAETGPSFFQRVTATKAFGLIDGRGSYSLTALAKQYFYPTFDHGKESAILQSFTTPKAFSILVRKFDGGKLPSTEMLGNIIHAEADIPVSKKSVLAALFLRSAKFIGAVDPDGFLRCKALVDAGKRALEAIDNGNVPSLFTMYKESAPETVLENEHNLSSEPIILYLSSDKKRVVKLVAPLAISNVEYERICTWIRATLIVEEGQRTP